MGKEIRAFFFCTLIFLTSCAARSSAMTQMEFNGVLLGTPISEVIAQQGAPYAIYDLPHGAEEYEYIERFSINNELAYENHYLLKVVNGQVVSKRLKEERRQAFDQIYQEDPNYPTYP